MFRVALVNNIIDQIETYKLDGIQNAANGIGPMGAGIAGAIRKSAGIEVQTEAFEVCRRLDPQVGTSYSTGAGQLAKRGIKRIIHAVTMKAPNGATTLEGIERAFEASIALAISEGITCLGCTALGTGVGGLSFTDVGFAMAKIAETYEASIDLVFLDRNQQFYDALKEYLI